MDTSHSLLKVLMLSVSCQSKRQIGEGCSARFSEEGSMKSFWCLALVGGAVVQSERVRRNLSSNALLVFLVGIACVMPASLAFAQGQLTNGASHTGVIQVGGLDTWTIQASLNDSITVSVGKVSGDPNFFPHIRLQGPDGSQLGSVGDQFSGSVAEIDARATSTGTFSVLVSNSTCCQQASPGSYVLTVVRTPGPYSTSAGDEGGSITNGASHSGVIQIGDLDVWTIQANLNDSITVSIGKISGDPNFFPHIRLLAPNGSQLGSVGDQFSGSAAEIDARATSAGTFSVLVSNSTCCQQSGPGSYLLTVVKTPGPFSTSDGDEGGPVTNGANNSGVIQIGDLDVWTIQGNLNDSITVSIGKVSGDSNFFPHIRLVGPDGSQLGSVGDQFSGNAAEIDARAASTGAFSVLVSNSTCCQQSAPGNYVLTVVQRPGAYTVSLGDEGGPIANATTHTGAIQIGDLDPWTFQAAANNNIVARIGKVSGDSNFFPHLRIIGPDGSQLGAAGDQFTGNAAEVDVHATSTGTYTAIISASGCCALSGPGNYSLTVSGLTVSPSPPTVNAFTASQLTIAAGQSSVLSWTTTNAATTSISGVSGPLLTIGSASVSPITTTTYTLTATGPGGTVTATVTVVVLSTAPTVGAVNPASGSTAGGTQVTVSGTNFSPGASVTFGGTAAEGVSVTGATTITCKTPSHSSGSVAVQVTNQGGQSGQLSNAFTYTAAAAPPPARRRAVSH
jgi:hypothetical protein